MFDRVLDTPRHNPEVFFKQGFLKVFANFTGKHLCRSLFYTTPLMAASLRFYANNMWS